MTDDMQSIAAQLHDVASRMDRIEDRLAANGNTDVGSRFQYLIARPHRWRRQLCIKGRNMTVGQLISTLRANRMSLEQASDRLDLPLAAICEALTYYAENRALIELEASEERRRLAQRGFALEPKALPG